MEKVIMFLIEIGFMMSSTACHESLVSDEMTGRNSEVSFPHDNSAAIEDLIQSLDSLIQYYQSIGRAGSGNTQQQEQDPKDSLHVIPAWVDHVGGLVWGHYGWDIGASAGTIISGGDPATTIAGGVLVGLAMHELGSAFASSLAQAIMDCNGYAFVSNPGYIDLSKIDYLPPLKPNDSIPENALS